MPLHALCRMGKEHRQRTALHNEAAEDRSERLQFPFPVDQLPSLQRQPVSHRVLVHRVNVAVFAAVQNHGNAGMLYRLVYLHLCLPQPAPRPVFRRVRIGVHGQLHQNERQPGIFKILPPASDQHCQQCTISIRSDLVVFALIIEKSPNGIRHYPLQHGVIHAGRTVGALDAQRPGVTVFPAAANDLVPWHIAVLLIALLHAALPCGVICHVFVILGDHFCIRLSRGGIGVVLQIGVTGSVCLQIGFRQPAADR